MSFEPLGRLLPKAIQVAGIQRQVTAARVLEEFQAVLHRLWGKEKAAYVHPMSFKEGELRVQAVAPAAAQELSVARLQIQNELNRSLGSKVVLKISVLMS